MQGLKVVDSRTDLGLFWGQFKAISLIKVPRLIVSRGSEGQDEAAMYAPTGYTALSSPAREIRTF
jgi:hypothetical protein